ncbi:MAG: DUF1634 domain-containing protein [Deinococcus sp.]|nr:DUF1634 domain-containing protein [Deinococcus sp.]
MSRARNLDRTVHAVLTVGLALSTALMATGLLLDWWRGREIPHYVLPLSEALARTLAGRASGFFSLGLLVLLATPVLRVAASVVAFLIERDWRYALVTLAVLGVMITSVLLGRG